MTEPREYTQEEVQTLFLRQVWTLIDYWKHEDFKDRCLEGLAFSILAQLDGEGIELPGFMIIPIPNASDQEYLQKKGENWFPGIKLGDQIEELCDIGGNLHEQFYAIGKELKNEAM